MNAGSPASRPTLSGLATTAPTSRGPGGRPRPGGRPTSVAVPTRRLDASPDGTRRRRVAFAKTLCKDPLHDDRGPDGAHRQAARCRRHARPRPPAAHAHGGAPPGRGPGHGERAGRAPRREQRPDQLPPPRLGRCGLRRGRCRPRRQGPGALVAGRPGRDLVAAERGGERSRRGRRRAGWLASLPPHGVVRRLADRRPNADPAWQEVSTAATTSSRSTPRSSTTCSARSTPCSGPG